MSIDLDAMAFIRQMVRQQIPLALESGMAISSTLFGFRRVEQGVAMLVEPLTGSCREDQLTMAGMTLATHAVSVFAVVEEVQVIEASDEADMANLNVMDSMGLDLAKHPRAVKKVGVVFSGMAGKRALMADVVKQPSGKWKVGELEELSGDPGDLGHWFGL